jgi:hypothetical protein
MNTKRQLLSAVNLFESATVKSTTNFFFHYKLLKSILQLIECNMFFINDNQEKQIKTLNESLIFKANLVADKFSLFEFSSLPFCCKLLRTLAIFEFVKSFYFSSQLLEVSSENASFYFKKCDRDKPTSVLIENYHRKVSKFFFFLHPKVVTLKIYYWIHRFNLFLFFKLFFYDFFKIIFIFF